MHFRHYFAAFILAATTFSAFSQEAEALDTKQVAIESTTPVISTMTIQLEAPTAESPKRTLPSFLTAKQVELLDQALVIGKADGHKQPELLQGILMQETKAGAAEYKSAKNNCFGIFQIKIAAAKDVLKNFPEMVLQFGISPDNNQKLRHMLIHNDEFNISVASKYLLLMKRYGYDTIKELALAYNQGAGGAKLKNPNTFGYSLSVVKHIKTLKTAI